MRADGELRLLITKYIVSIDAMAPVFLSSRASSACLSTISHPQIGDTSVTFLAK